MRMCGISTEFTGRNFNHFKTPRRIRKAMDGLPLTRKFANGCQEVIQGQGHFTKCDLPWGISPVV